VSDTLAKVQELVRASKFKVSDHGYNELANDKLLASEIIAGLAASLVIEDYPSYPKGPCALVLEKDALGSPIHALWGIPAGKSEPAVLITAYRPDPAKWDSSSPGDAHDSKKANKARARG
jgi:hypothetical protein